VVVTYSVAAHDEEAARRRARLLALEQTVELPDGRYPHRLEADVVARVGGVSRAATGRWYLELSLTPALVTGSVPELLNFVFGNASLGRDVVLEDLRLPPDVLAVFGGPRHGISGFRAACGAATRPMLATVAKPVGLSSAELADRCATLARAGFDLVKDDHGIMDPPWSPFADRVPRCWAAISEANARHGGRTLYFPNVTGPSESLNRRLDIVREAGCPGVLVSPYLTGLDCLQRVARSSDLLIMVHPTHSRAVTRPAHGIAAPVALGTLMRLLGADAAVFVNPGGRFEMDSQECVAVVDRLRVPMAPLAPALPVAGGGVTAAAVPDLVRRYGGDIMFLVGSDLHAAPDLEMVARRLVDAVRKGSDA
jgi:ribulose-bisphosphate carboxylase large chain